VNCNTTHYRATSIAGSAVDAATLPGIDQQSWNQANAVLSRAAVLERVKVQKAC